MVRNKLNPTGCFTVKYQVLADLFLLFNVATRRYLITQTFFAVFLAGISTGCFAKDFGFDETVDVNHEGETTQLSLTGATERSVLFFDVYSLAHYAADLKPTDDQSVDIYTQLIDANITKQISIVFSRDLEANQIQETLSDGIKDNCDADEFQQVKSDLDLFKRAINQDVKKHDEFSLRWLASGKLLMLFHGEVVGELESPLLARLLWSIWFGDDAVVDRAELVSKVT